MDNCILARDIKRSCISKGIKFHREFSIEYVNHLAELKLRTEGEWNEFKDDYAYTAVKHYIIAICSTGLSVGYHTAKEICEQANINDFDIFREIKEAMVYASELGYLEKVNVYNKDGLELDFFKIIRRWN